MSKPSNSAPGKKQVSIPGPNSEAYKQLAAQNVASVVKPAKLSLRARQRIVEDVKRAIWAKVREINDAIITLAMAGNYSAAKALFEFAGVYSLPAPDDAPSTVPAAVADPAPTDNIDLTDPINAFFKSIGLEPAREVPPPQPAA